MKKGRFSSQLALVALSSGREIDVVRNVALCENKKIFEENKDIWSSGENSLFKPY